MKSQTQAPSPRTVHPLPFNLAEFCLTVYTVRTVLYSSILVEQILVIIFWLFKWTFHRKIQKILVWGLELYVLFSLQYDIVFPNKKFRGGKTAQFQSYQEFIVSPKCAFKKENEGRRERDKDKITQNNNKESRAGHAQFLLGAKASTRHIL